MRLGSPRRNQYGADQANEAHRAYPQTRQAAGDGESQARIALTITPQSCHQGRFMPAPPTVAAASASGLRGQPNSPMFFRIYAIFRNPSPQLPRIRNY